MIVSATVPCRVLTAVVGSLCSGTLISKDECNLLVFNKAIDMYVRRTRRGRCWRITVFVLAWMCAHTTCKLKGGQCGCALQGREAMFYNRL